MNANKVLNKIMKKDKSKNRKIGTCWNCGADTPGTNFCSKRCQRDYADSGKYLW